MKALIQRRAQQGQAALELRQQEEREAAEAASPPLSDLEPPLPPPQTPSPPQQVQQQQQPQPLAGAFDDVGADVDDLTAGLPPGAAHFVASVAAAMSAEVTSGPVLEPSRALSAYREALAQRTTATVSFQLRMHSQSGQRVRVVGGHEELGNWDVPASPEMLYAGGDLWQITVRLPTGCVVEYKYVLLDHSGHGVAAWQSGNNNVLAVRLTDGGLEVQDNWGGDMRGQVIADGGAPETREGRLAAWAGDLFAQMGSQRSDLRRSRLELAGAKEAEQDARDEAHFFRAQYKVKEAERAEAVAALSEVHTLNLAMDQQLADTTNALMDAIDTAESLLGEIDASKATAAQEAADVAAAAAVAAPRPRRTRRSAAAIAADAAAAAAAAAERGEEAPAAAPKRVRRRAPALAVAAAGENVVGGEGEGTADALAVKAPVRRRRAAASKVTADAE